MSSSRIKNRARNQALRRYVNQRRRNLLAQPGPLPFVVVLDHLKAGFNVPKIFRSAQAFGAREVHLIDIGPFDPAPAKGAFKAVPARFFDTIDQSLEVLRARDYTVFALEPDGRGCVYDCDLPVRSAFVFGHEELGLSFSRRDYPEIRAIRIPQTGAVQSLNVSIAASLVMYEYARRYRYGV
jgi:tRNA G18 (ribose-2'-O)-methylase SpoU